MIGYNNPAAFDLFEQQVIMTAHVANISFQMPFTYKEIVERARSPVAAVVFGVGEPQGLAAMRGSARLTSLGWIAFRVSG